MKNWKATLHEVLRWVSLAGIPGLTVLVATLGSIWGWPWATQACATLAAVDACLGTFIGINSNRERLKVDGGIVVDDEGNIVDIVADEDGKKIADGKSTIKLQVMKDSDVPYGK